MTKAMTTLRVNGETHTVAVEPHHTLLEVLREELNLTGTKHGCELGECGACTVLVDGVPVLSCLTLPAQLGELEVLTVEGLANGPELHPLQTAFAEEGAAQCGYCTPGMLMSAKALLEATPHPSRKEIAQAISGNLCRCTGYTAIYEAIERASDERFIREERDQQSGATRRVDAAQRAETSARTGRATSDSFARSEFDERSRGGEAQAAKQAEPSA